MRPPLAGRRAAGALLAVVAAAAALSGCRASVLTNVILDGSGKGVVIMRATLDAGAQAHLSRPGLDLTGAGPADAARIAARLFPWTIRDGWSALGGGSAPLSVARDAAGHLVLSTEHPVVSARALQELMATRQPTSALVDGKEVPTDLPASVPFLNDYSLSLSSDGTNFNMFGRGGVGTLEAKTCSGHALLRSASPADRALRSGLTFDYRFTFPDVPRGNTANRVDGKRADWTFPYGDCPRLGASSDRGSSSEVLNGAILAGAAALILLVLLLRGLRRRRERRAAAG